MPVSYNDRVVLLTRIEREEVLKYLGYKDGEIETKYLEKIDFYSRLVMETAKPRCEFMPWDIEGSNPVRLADSDVVLPGKDIAKHLEGCDMVCLMAATLGSDIDFLIRRKSVESMSDAVILDACASVAIENVCDNFEQYLEKSYLKEDNTYITDRYSPGYGDFPIELQRDICNLTLSYKRMGLTCNESFLLTPAKSVTAVIGLSDTPREKRITGCIGCILKNDCEYRKRGITCYE